MQEAGKQVDSVFLTRGGVVPDYGDYYIEKDLKSPRQSSLVNLIPEEHITRRPISLRHKAMIIVPDEEVHSLREKYPGYQFSSRSDRPVTHLSRLQALPELPGKLYRSFRSKFAEDFSVKNIHPKAVMGGSTRLGIGVPGTQDLDVLIPVKYRSGVVSLRERLLKRYPGLKDSPYNTANRRKTVLRGTIQDKDVDIVLAPEDKVRAYDDSMTRAASRLTPDKIKEIVSTKQKLKNAWLFPETRYKWYKKDLDDDLGIAKF
jgi:hypothetical protein